LLNIAFLISDEEVLLLKKLPTDFLFSRKLILFIFYGLLISFFSLMLNYFESLVRLDEVLTIDCGMIILFERSLNYYISIDYPNSSSSFYLFLKTVFLSFTVFD
jgi:hypothetical protein